MFTNIVISVPYPLLEQGGNAVEYKVGWRIQYDTENDWQDHRF
jgi:hypothetical protein